jgi:hypothetical protein
MKWAGNRAPEDHNHEIQKEHFRVEPDGCGFVQMRSPES